MCWRFGLQLVPWRGEGTQSNELSEDRVLLEEAVTENTSLKCISYPWALFSCPSASWMPQANRFLPLCSSTVLSLPCHRPKSNRLKSWAGNPPPRVRKLVTKREKCHRNLPCFEVCIIWINTVLPVFIWLVFKPCPFLPFSLTPSLSSFPLSSFWKGVSICSHWDPPISSSWVPNYRYVPSCLLYLYMCFII